MNALVLLNPKAGSGRALRQFREIEPLLPTLLDDFLVATTSSAGEITKHLESALAAGYDTILAMGGDGTNFALINALAQFPGHDFTIATLPMGSGRDWARTLKIPQDPEAALRWMTEATPRPVDLGCIRYDGQSQRFLNVASAGLSGEVSRRTNVPVKRPWTFLQATITTLLEFDALPMRVTVDGKVWYEGGAFLLAVGNGQYFGRGMHICPEAKFDDGFLDVVLVERMNKLKVLAALPSLFQGTHIRRADVHTRRARHVLVEAIGPDLGIDMDGEMAGGRRVEFEVMPHALKMLINS
ncbi:MAG: diacylglycerol kinase family lipid kinase [Ardenticatenales bacterium]|nr:diacylglycerol kinase family lipid kinase [Ardenticatenales bacterium]